VRTQVLRRGGDEAGEGGDEPTRFVQIALRAVVGIGIGQAQLLGRGTHQHDRRSRDDLDGRNLGQVADVS